MNLSFVVVSYLERQLRKLEVEDEKDEGTHGGSLVTR